MFLVEKQGAVATLAYSHPPHGLLTLAAIRQLRHEFRALERDPATRVIRFRGTILHTELDEIEQLLRIASWVPRLLIPLVAWVASWFSPFAAIARSKKITLFAMEGPCIGGGLELALACDYRLASDEDAHVIGCPEVRMGLLPGFGGSHRLAELIGRPRALELLLSGDLLTPREAARLGLVSRLMAPAQMLEFAEELARRPPLAVASIKRARGLNGEMREVLRLARSQDVALGLREYRCALSESAQIRPLLQRMERVTFRGN